MNYDIRDEGQAANMRGISRENNPYPYPSKSNERASWDLGWLIQTQEWATKPKRMCKGKNCTALDGDLHSSECINEHNIATHVIDLVDK